MQLNQEVCTPKLFSLTGMRDIFLFLSFQRQDELIFFLEARLNLFLHSFNTFSFIRHKGNFLYFYFFPFGDKANFIPSLNYFPSWGKAKFISPFNCFPFLSEDRLFFFYFLPFLEAFAISKLGLFNRRKNPHLYIQVRPSLVDRMSCEGKQV